MFKTVIASLFFVLTCGGLAFAEDGNVYVRLYGQRVELAKATIKRQQAEIQFQLARLHRVRTLVTKAAVSVEEAERTEADYKKSVAEEEVLKAKLGEEQATLEVVKLLVLNSQPIPLCRD